MGTTNKEDGVNYTGNIEIPDNKEPSAKDLKEEDGQHIVPNSENDLNRDGKVDEKDYAIAGRTLQSKRKTKKVK